jgi:hypothetical protein
MKLFIVVWGLVGLFAWGKVVGHLDWSWWLVFSPVWFTMVVGALLAGGAMIGAYMIGRDLK